MYGHLATDRYQAELDPIGLFGAETQLELAVKADFRTEPQYLTASNKAAEHNILNQQAVIPQAQLPGPMFSAFRLRLISRNIELPSIMGG